MTEGGGSLSVTKQHQLPANKQLCSDPTNPMIQGSIEHLMPSALYLLGESDTQELHQVTNLTPTTNIKVACYSPLTGTFIFTV
jgi:hypothetical protein